MPSSKPSAMFRIGIVLLLLLCIIPANTVCADTDGSELKITSQPDKLILELGADWAGAQFELKLDTGVFPVPVVVSDAGVLTMDLGGSKTYSLKLLTQIPTPAQWLTSSPVPAPEPMETQTVTAITPPDAGENMPAPKESVPVLPLVIFLIVFLACGAVLAVMYMMKKRRAYSYDDEYDDSDDYGDE